MLRFLNIEVALGLVALAMVASDVLQAPLPIGWFVVVPLTAWAVYTLDRIIDSRSPALIPNTGRHAFHATHRHPLQIGVVAAILIAGGIALLTFPARYWVVAAGLGSLTALHLALQRTQTRATAVVKDVNVMLTYTLSAWAIPLVDASSQQRWDSIGVWLPTMIVTLLIVLIDVLLLSLIDRNEDAGAGRPSIAVALGTTGTLRTAGALGAVSIAVTMIWVIPNGHIAVGSALICMVLCYAFLSRFNFSDPAAARLALEWVLVLPLPFVALH